MGLIKAGLGALGGTLADQWKEFFYCDALPLDVLVAKGQKRTSKRSSNIHGEDNIISNGSVIAVADGQCMLIVEQGKVVEVCAEPGEFKWDSSTEPSLFTGKFGTALVETFKTMGKRFTFGGDTGKDQRVYYVNTKEILDNKFGTANPVPFRVVDARLGLDVDVSIRCAGIYTYKITDPIKFYTNVCSNVVDFYSRKTIDSTLKTEFISALQPAFGVLSDLQMRPNQIVTHTAELEKAMNEVLSQKWNELRGISVVSVALASLTLPEEDQEMIKRIQKDAIYRDPTMAAAGIVGAQTDAMRTAAGNTAGAMAGFMGMGMAMNQGGANASQLFGLGQQNQQENGNVAAGNGWKCKCGSMATGKFCPECGSARPAAGSWKCSCGAENTGKFCQECGAKKPAGAMVYKCDKCGWVPDNPANPPKFCPECGDIFNDDDIVK